MVALPAEARALIDSRVRPGELRGIGDGAWLAVCGVGASAARRAALQLVQAQVSALVSWGTAGGLDPRLGAGTLVLPERVISVDSESFAVDAGWRLRLAEQLHPCGKLAGGTLLSSQRLLATREAKAAAYARYQAAAVDMESAAIAAVAGERGLPFVALRVVVDAADQALPIAAAVALDGRGRLQPAALGAALLRRPQQLIGLARLAARFARARRALRCAERQAGALLRRPGPVTAP